MWKTFLKAGWIIFPIEDIVNILFQTNGSRSTEVCVNYTAVDREQDDG